MTVSPRAAALRRWSWSLLACLPLFGPLGCSDGDTQARPERERHPLWQTQLDALDKARGVEDMVRDQAQERRRQIDELEKR